MKKCPSCGGEVQEKWISCPACAASLRTDDADPLGVNRPAPPQASSAPRPVVPSAKPTPSTSDRDGKKVGFFLGAALVSGLAWVIRLVYLASSDGESGGGPWFYAAALLALGLWVGFFAMVGRVTRYVIVVLALLVGGKWGIDRISETRRVREEQRQEAERAAAAKRAEEERVAKLREDLPKNYQEAVALLDAGKHADALALFKKVAEVDPGYEDLKARMGAAQAEVDRVRAQEAEERRAKAAEEAQARREKAQADATEAAKREAEARRAAAPIALLNAKGYESEGGYHLVEGQVRNKSDQPIRNLQAVATWYTKDGTFITSDDALIDYNPLMPGQTSPFKTMTRSNPQMSRYTVEFRILMGPKLDMDDQRKK